MYNLYVLIWLFFILNFWIIKMLLFIYFVTMGGYISIYDDFSLSRNGNDTTKADMSSSTNAIYYDSTVDIEKTLCSYHFNINNNKHFRIIKNDRFITGRHVVICAAWAHSNNIINSWNKSHKNDNDFVLKPIVVVCQGIHTCSYAKTSWSQ